jgi:F-type H+-transporting ATPase subunit b
MAIDWITVSAQIINFLILVWLLKRFLYQPVMRAVARREQRITEQLNEAVTREQKADEQAQQFQAKIDKFEQQREGLIAKAKQEIEQNKRRMLDEAREEVSRTREQWQQQVDLEKEAFLNQFRHHSTDVIQMLARKALADLADANLETQIIQSFIDRLKTLDQESLKLLADLSEPARIVTTFKLNAAARTHITHAIQEYFPQTIDVEFSESSGLLCGIECTIGGQRLGWHLADYLTQLNHQVEEAFAAAERSGT